MVFGIWCALLVRVFAFFIGFLVCIVVFCWCAVSCARFVVDVGWLLFVVCFFLLVRMFFSWFCCFVLWIFNSVGLCL